MVVKRAKFVVVALTFAVAASCGGGGGEDVTASTAPPTITNPPSEIVPYCDATIEFTIFLYDAIGTIQQASAADLAATAQGLGATLQPLAAAALAEVPDEIEAQFVTVSGAIDAMATSGSVAELQSDEVVSASEELHEFNSRSCGWPIIQLVATDRSIGGVPQQLGPGYVVFRIRNDSSRELQIDLYRDALEGDTEPLTARFPADRPIEPHGVTLAVSSVVAPGGQGTQLVNLEVGRYAFVLADPAGTANLVRQFVAGSATAVRVVEGG